MSMSVPAILKYLHNSSSSNEDDYDNVLADMENNDNPGRSKKRRLDHLTWEEKIQRKKLKNRVAAQTSRDRKKAKMEQMETAIRELFDKNEQLISECEKLRTLNEKLQLENQELHGRLTAPCASCAQQQQQRQHQSRPVECLGRNGPAEGSGHSLSSGFECGGGGSRAPALPTTACCPPPEDCSGLPSLPDLLDELNRDVDLSSLEEITQSLLQDIAADLEASAQKANCQESDTTPTETELIPEQMVGSPAEHLESDRCGRVNGEELEIEISPYLLLHHDYFAKRPPKSAATIINRRRRSTRPHPPHRTNLKTKKFKDILPKTETLLQKPAFSKARAPEIVVEKDASDLVYGTYDESTNCIVILNDDLRLDEAVTEVVTSPEDVDSLPASPNFLKVPTSDRSKDEYSLSPAPSSGYESLDSPSSETTDIWDECVSELFPSLL